MIGRLSVLALATLACVMLGGRPGHADPFLTCADFKTHLDQTIGAMGSLVAAPGPLKPGYDSRETGKRYEWDGIVGLTGTMTCGKTDAFEDFSIAIGESYRTSDELPVVLKRFMELASASICTLAEATPDACRALTRSMTDGSLLQFKEAMAKGDAVPTGTQDFFIVDGVDAELDMTPVGISWSIGPGQAMTTSAIRAKLAPRNVDR